MIYNTKGVYLVEILATDEEELRQLIWLEASRKNRRIEVFHRETVRYNPENHDDFPDCDWWVKGTDAVHTEIGITCSLTGEDIRSYDINEWKVRYLDTVFNGIDD